MHSCFCRHRALAFGGGNGSKNGSMIKEGGNSRHKDNNPLTDIVNNATYNESDKIKMKDIRKVKIPADNNLNSDDIDLFDQYAILVYT